MEENKKSGPSFILRPTFVNEFANFQVAPIRTTRYLCQLQASISLFQCYELGTCIKQILKDSIYDGVVLVRTKSERNTLFTALLFTSRSTEAYSIKCSSCIV